MNTDFTGQAADAKEKKDEVITATEHTAIILRYSETGQLDRDDAIKKYKDFNAHYPEYYLQMTALAERMGTSAKVDDEGTSDGVIVGNLNQQLLYLTGKNLLKKLQQNGE